jgi:hypothetical protein
MRMGIWSLPRNITSSGGIAAKINADIVPGNTDRKKGALSGKLNRLFNLSGKRKR